MNILRRYITVFLIFPVSIITPVAATDFPDFTALIEKNAAAVVNIHVVAKREQQEPLSMPEIPESHRDLWEFFRRFQPMPEQRAPVFGSGSGFIIDAAGYIITNAHVVVGKEEGKITVRLNDRREYMAELIGADERSDLAVLKISEAEDLPVLQLGDSDQLRVGEWVFAIGSPFGFDYSATAGIISALGRNLPSENYVPFIQTDVAINRGNSGGPLFNMKGEVVGVNSQIYSPTGAFSGLSFSVPANMVSRVYEQLRTRGRVERGWLGVLIQDVTTELAESFDMDIPRGALIAQVLDDSPSAQAGVQPGDIILSYGDTDIATSSDLPPLVGRTEVGQVVELQVLRAGEKMALEVNISALPDEDKIRQMSVRGGDTEEGLVDLGVKFSAVEEVIRESYGVAEGGVQITEVLANSPADLAGLRKGDIITQWNNEQVKGIQHFKEILAVTPVDKAVAVLVQRKDGAVFVPLRLQKNNNE